MKIGFAIVMASPFFDKIISIQNTIAARYPFRDLLGAEHNLPHTTLFQGSFSESINYQEIADRAAEKLSLLLPDKMISFTDVIYKAEGWYFFMIEKTPELQQLHELVLSEIMPDLILDPDRMNRNISGLSEDEIAGIQNYGYRYSGAAFFPHITIGRTAAGRNEDLLNELNTVLRPESASIGRITVYRMGPDGTHADTLYEINL